MDDILKLIEAYMREAQDYTLSPLRIFINMVLCTALSTAVAKFYIRFGNAVSNRRRFAANFVPLALITMSILLIVRPSVGLSLGLVGALSIVRFRAAIKDPEELTYIFLVIAIGLGTGADRPWMATLIVLSILLFLYVSQQFGAAPNYKLEDKMYVNITSDENNLSAISAILQKHFLEVTLKRLDTLDEGIDLTFLCKSTELATLDKVQTELRALTPNMKISMIDQPDLII